MPPLPAALSTIARTPRPPRSPARLASFLLDLLFPARCAGCQRIGALLCVTCLARVRPVPHPVCRRCGKPQAVEGVCAVCSGVRFAVGMIRAAAIYADPLGETIRQFKYDGRKELAGPLGNLLAGCWQNLSAPVDLVAPVPLHEQRLRERGYNQSRLLAEAFCLATGLPLLDFGVLRRERETRQQVRLSMLERQENVAGAFAWRGPALDGASVLLIDDVATTGSTLEACGQVLLDAGAGRVWALTAARAVQADF